MLRHVHSSFYDLLSEMPKLFMWFAQYKFFLSKGVDSAALHFEEIVFVVGLLKKISRFFSRGLPVS